MGCCWGENQLASTGCEAGGAGAGRGDSPGPGLGVVHSSQQSVRQGARPSGLVPSPCGCWRRLPWSPFRLWHCGEILGPLQRAGATEQWKGTGGFGAVDILLIGCEKFIVLMST